MSASVPTVDPAKCTGEMRQNEAARLIVNGQTHCGAFRTLETSLSPMNSRGRKYPK